MTAPEDANPTLLKQTIEGARTHLVALTTYLASLAALVGGHHVLVKKLEYSNLEALLFASIPLVLSLLFLTLPAWLKRRREAKLRYFGIHGKLEDPGYFLLRPYEARDRGRFRRPDGADADVLEWIRTTQEPLLYLTGRSGAGKSSLLGASVLPQLQEGTDPAFHVISVRSYRDPSDELRQALREPGAIRQSPPDDGLRRLLEKAAAHLGPKRLLVVVDQFEELLILHDDGKRHEFVELLRSLYNDLIPGLCVLLSARSDYLGPIGDLELGPLELRKTWMEISPFTEMAARAFLEDSGLGLSEKRLDDLIQEAAEIEETRGQIRPITLNLLGVVVSRQESRPLKSGRVLRDYLAEAIEENELSDCARQILEGLITDVGTKEPQSVEEISGQGNLDVSMVRGGLLRLGNLGLVRQIDPKRGVWEVSHDFLARLLGSIIGRWRRPWWQELWSWVAPLGLVLWVAAIGSSIHSFNESRQARTVASLSNLGFSVVQTDERYIVRFSKPQETLALLPTVALLRSLDPKPILLHIAHAEIYDIGPLNQLSMLQSLNLSGTSVDDIDPLSQLSQLQSLDLSGTPIHDIKPLSQLSNLQSLNLNGTTVDDINPLSQLSMLKSLDLYSTQVDDINPLNQLAQLQSLDFSGTLVNDINPLSQLTQLKSLDLNGTPVDDINPLSQLSQLQLLNLNGTSVGDIKSLSQLSKLQSLDLSFTRVDDVKPLSQLAQLQSLDLSFTQVDDINPLCQLTQLKSLDLRRTQVKDISPLNQLAQLQSLYLSRTQVDDINPLSQLVRLQSLYLYSTQVDDIRPLSQLAQLKSLYISGTRIDDINPLSQLTQLKSLDLSRTQVGDISPLSQLAQLKSLDLDGTQVDDISPLSQLSQLQLLDLRRTQVEDLTPLAELQARGLKIYQ